MHRSMAVLMLTAVFTACSPIDNRSTNKAIARIMAIAIDRFKGDKVIEMWHTTEDLDVR